MSNTDWWAKQLGTQQQVPQARPAAMPMPPSQQPMQPNYTPHQSPVQPQDTPRGLSSASQTGNCPDCRSTNYMAVQGAKPRCMDCGYPLEQSGGRFGALNGAKVEGNATAALGNDTTNNYNPQTIIGRI